MSDGASNEFQMGSLSGSSALGVLIVVVVVSGCLLCSLCVRAGIKVYYRVPVVMGVRYKGPESVNYVPGDPVVLWGGCVMERVPSANTGIVDFDAHATIKHSRGRMAQAGGVGGGGEDFLYFTGGVMGGGGRGGRGDPFSSDRGSLRDGDDDERFRSTSRFLFEEEDVDYGANTTTDEIEDDDYEYESTVGTTGTERRVRFNLQTSTTGGGAPSSVLGSSMARSSRSGSDSDSTSQLWSGSSTVSSSVSASSSSSADYVNASDIKVEISSSS